MPWSGGTSPRCSGASGSSIPATGRSRCSASATTSFWRTGGRLTETVNRRLPPLRYAPAEWSGIHRVARDIAGGRNTQESGVVGGVFQGKHGRETPVRLQGSAQLRPGAGLLLTLTLNAATCLAWVQSTEHCQRGPCTCNVHIRSTR